MVFPGVDDVMASPLRRVSMLIRLLFPTFERPINAYSGLPFTSGHWSARLEDTRNSAVFISIFLFFRVRGKDVFLQTSFFFISRLGPTEHSCHKKHQHTVCGVARHGGFIVHDGIEEYEHHPKQHSEVAVACLGFLGHHPIRLVYGSTYHWYLQHGKKDKKASDTGKDTCHIHRIAVLGGVGYQGNGKDAVFKECKDHCNGKEGNDKKNFC